MIVPVFFQGSKRQIELCKRYWSYDRGFVHTLLEIAQEFDMEPWEVEKTAAQYCSVRWLGHVCGICNEPLRVFNNRQEFLAHIDDIQMRVEKAQTDLFLCRSCFLKRPVNLNKAHEVLEDEGAELKQAFYRGEHFQLEPELRSFLLNLAEENSFDDVVTWTGLSVEQAQGYMDKLVEKGLLAWKMNNAGYWMPPQLYENIAAEKLALRPVFQSAEEPLLYRMLQEKYLFVYPRVPLVAFVSLEQVSDLFEQPWHKAWFLTHTFDYVITNRQGVPVKVIELEEHTGNGKKEAFIAQILERIELPRVKESVKRLMENKA